MPACRTHPHPAWWRLALLAGLALLTGCATLSESECVRGDWFGIGLSDARSGHRADRLGEHQKACAKHGYGVDRPAYEAGYHEGLVDFCTPAQAFRSGRDGKNYPDQCPLPLSRSMRPAWELGSDVHALERELDDYQREMNKLDAEIRDDKTSDANREVALRRVRHVQTDHDRRERERDRLLEQARRRGYGNVW